MQQDMGHQLKQQARQAMPWMEKFARFGYADLGIVYILLGLLALETGFGLRRQAPETKDALFALMARPAGKWLALVLTAGLGAFAVWCLASALVDLHRRGNSLKGWGMRVAEAAMGLPYLAMAFAGGRMLLGHPQAHNPERAWSTRLLALPWGQELVILAGLLVLAYAGAQWYLAFSGRLFRQMNRKQPAPDMQPWLRVLGRFGFAVKGLVFALIGGFLIRAAWQYDPRQAQGLAGALHTVARQPFGFALFIAAALGLVAYGIFQCLRARFQRRLPY